MAEPGGLSFEDACALGDLVLELPASHGEQEKRCIGVHRSQVILASSVLRHMLVDEQGSADEGLGLPRKRQREGEAEVPHLPLPDSYEEWLQALKHLHGLQQGEISQLTLEEALFVLPLAHKYNMWQLLNVVLAAVRRVNSHVFEDVKLLETLSLGMRLNYDAIVSACWRHVETKGAAALLRRAMCCDAKGAALRELSMEAQNQIMAAAVGVLPRLQGLSAPDLSKPCRSSFALSDKLPPNERASPEHRLLAYSSGKLFVAATGYTLVGAPASVVPAYDMHVFDVNRDVLEGALQQPPDPADGCSNRSRSYTCLACTWDGRLAVSGDTHGRLKVWEVQTRACARSQPARSTSDCVTAVAVCAESKCVVATRGGCVAVWDIEAGAEVVRMAGHRAGDPRGPSNPWLSTSPSGSTSPLILSFISPPPTGPNAASADLTAWDWRTGKKVRALVTPPQTSAAGAAGAAEPPAAGQRCIKCVATDASGHVAISGSEDGFIRQWDLGSGTCVAEAQVSATSPAAGGAAAGTTAGTAAAVALQTTHLVSNASGTCVVSLDSARHAYGQHQHGQLSTWDLRHGLQRAPAAVHVYTTPSCLLSSCPDLSSVLVGSCDTHYQWTVKVW